MSAIKTVLSRVGLSVSRSTQSINSAEAEILLPVTPACCCAETPRDARACPDALFAIIASSGSRTHDRPADGKSPRCMQPNFASRDGMGRSPLRLENGFLVSEPFYWPGCRRPLLSRPRSSLCPHDRFSPMLWQFELASRCKITKQTGRATSGWHSLSLLQSHYFSNRSTTAASISRLSPGWAHFQSLWGTPGPELGLSV